MFDLKPQRFGNWPDGRGQLPAMNRAACAAAFTLVELLVVMMIMGILASIVLFALASAQETAKRDKTISTINKLNALITAKYESYRTRRVPVDVQKVAAYYTSLGSGDKRQIASSVPYAQAISLARLSALRDLMRLEMPDSFADIDDDPITQWANNAASTMTVPAVTRPYRAALAQGRNNPKYSQGTHEETAACLYMIITKGTDDPDVLEQFSPSEIDTAGDGMPIFIDGWGKPISYLRWAPRYASPLQPWDDSTSTAPAGNDPYDVLDAQEKFLGQHTFPLYPLIYSGGPDKKADIGESGNSNPQPRYSKFNNNPFDPAFLMWVGAYKDYDNDGDNRGDNITNHDLGGQ